MAFRVDTLSLQESANAAVCHHAGFYKRSARAIDAEWLLGLASLLGAALLEQSGGAGLFDQALLTETGEGAADQTLTKTPLLVAG